MTDLSPERDLLARLTNLFVDTRSIYKFSSLKLWTGENGEIRFFLTNNLPPNYGNRGHPPAADVPSPARPPPPSRTPEPSSPTPPPRTSPATARRQSKRGKKRHISGADSPEIFREDLECAPDLNVSLIQTERDEEDDQHDDQQDDDEPVYAPSVPVTNKYDILTDRSEEEKANCDDSLASYIAKAKIAEARAKEFNNIMFCRK